MLSNDLVALENKYQKKCDGIKNMLEIRPTENGMQIWEHCNRALSQLKDYGQYLKGRFNDYSKS